jgi:hypothetical protein
MDYSAHLILPMRIEFRDESILRARNIRDQLIGAPSSIQSCTRRMVASSSGGGVGLVSSSWRAYAARRGPGWRRCRALVFELPIWVVTHEDLRASRRVAIVFDHLVTVTALTGYARA